MYVIFTGVELLKGLYPGSKRERKIHRRMFTSCIKSRIRWFYVVVVQWTSKLDVLKNVMHVKSCCFDHKHQLFFDVVVVVVVVSQALYYPWIPLWI